MTINDVIGDATIKVSVMILLMMIMTMMMMMMMMVMLVMLWVTVCYVFANSLGHSFIHSPIRSLTTHSYIPSFLNSALKIVHVD